jgi:hypothetical protein
MPHADDVELRLEDDRRKGEAVKPHDRAPDTTIVVRPWIDPVVDEDGFDPRSRYVELFWLGVLGPTTI